MTAMTNIAAASMASTPSSKDGGDARPKGGERKAKHEQGAGAPDDKRREDDARDVLSACEGPHKELLELSFLPVNPGLPPRVRPPVEDGQRHSARRKEKG